MIMASSSSLSDFRELHDCCRFVSDYFETSDFSDSKVKEIINIFNQNTDLTSAESWPDLNPAFCAIQLIRADILDAVLRNGIDVNLVYYDGFKYLTLIDLATRSQNSEIFRVLIKYNIDLKLNINRVNTYNSFFPSVLMKSMRYFDKDPNYDCFKEILKSPKISEIINMQTEKYGGGSSALGIAIHKQKIEWIELLLNAGADLEMRNFLGETPLLEATDTNPQIVKFLIERGANLHVTRRFDSVLSCVCMYMPEKYGDEKTELIEFLLQKGCDPNTHIGRHEEPLIFTIVRNCQNSLLLPFIQAGLDLNIKHRDKRKSLLHWAIKHENFEALETFLKSGVDVNIKDEEGDTPLHETVGNDFTNPEMAIFVIKKLLQFNADVNAKDYANYTPLHIAVILQNKRVMDLLLTSGADPNSLDDVERSPIMLNIITNDNAELTDDIIHAGGDLSYIFPSGHTAMHVAAWHGHPRQVQHIGRHYLEYLKEL